MLPRIDRPTASRRRPRQRRRPPREPCSRPSRCRRRSSRAREAPVGRIVLLRRSWCLAGLPGRRPAVGVDHDRQGRHRAAAASGPTTSPGRRTSWSAPTAARASPRPSASASAPAAPSGQRTDTIMLLHTGSGPNLLLSIPRDSLVEIPGHGQHQDQRRLRHRRPEAAGPDDRAEHRHPDRPLRRDRLRRLRELRRRRRRHHDLPEASG